MTSIQKGLLGTTVTIAIALAGGSAFAAGAAADTASSGAYASVFAGGAFLGSISGNYTAGTLSPTYPLDRGYILGVTFGANVTPSLRGELEVTYANQTMTGTTVATGPGGSNTYQESGSTATTFLLGNVWYDLKTGSAITPYVGGGAGVAMVMPNFTSGTWSWSTGYTAPAAQIGAGVKIGLADGVGLDLGYRLKASFNGSMVATHGYSVANTMTLDQTLQAGLTFGF